MELSASTEKRTMGALLNSFSASAAGFVQIIRLRLDHRPPQPPEEPDLDTNQASKVVKLELFGKETDT